MLKKFLIGTFALALMLSIGVLTADAFSGATLRQGSKGADVMELQTKLGLTADGSFGPMTKAAVMAFQASNGLTADGIAGPMTLAKMSAPVGGNYPAGCTSNTGFSSTTGQSCAVVVAPGLPAGCSSTVGFSSTTGAKCDGSTTPSDDNNGPLVGGAGELLYSGTTTDLESNVKEGGQEKVLATKLEADSSDVSVGSVKVSFENNSGNGSTRLEKYVDEVVIMLGDKEVGSADASDFSKDGDVYSKSIATTGAIVRDGDKANLYVALKTLGTVDDETADFDGIITQVRWTDATGALFSDSDSDGSDFGTGANQTDIGFDEANVDDSLEVKTASSNPDDSTVTVDNSDTTDDVLALAFKLDVDEDSADVTVNDMMLTINVTNFDADGSATVDGSDDIDVSATAQWADRIISEVNVKVGGETYEADLDANVTTAQDVTDGAGALTYTVDFDDSLVIASGDDETVEVLVTFAEQSASDYNEGVIVTVSLADEDDISAETENDELGASEITGAGKTGADLTLSLSSATVDVTNITESGNSNDADDSYEEGTFTFYVTIAAEDGAVDVDATSIVETLLDPAANTVALSLQIVNLDGDATENTAGTDYTVEDGDSNTFSIVYTINPDAAGVYYVRLDSIDGVAIDESTEGVNLVVA